MNILIAALSFVVACNTFAASFRIAYVIPRQEEDMFYGPTVGFMREAAKQLDIDLEVVELKNNHLLAATKIDDLMKSKRKLDGIIVVSLKESGAAILRQTKSANIPVLIENGAIITKSVGLPRQLFPNYIGEILPDEETAGFDLANVLINTAASVSGDFTELIAIGGQFGSSATVGRENGLNRSLSQNKTIELKQLVNFEWERNAGKISLFVNRYPKAKIFWAASDGIALGVVDYAKKNKLKPGKDIFTGGVDWSVEGVAAVKSGDFVASAGGHFMEGAMALIEMYDYLNGIDFAQSEGLQQKTPMHLLTKENLSKFSLVLEKKNWNKINFKSFSKKLNPTIKKYNFDFIK